jgi:FtsH-binding integral membrane protein
MKSLYKTLFAFLGYLILVIPCILGFFIYPDWLFIICIIISIVWFGPWLYDQYIIHKFRKNNPLNKG